MERYSSYKPTTIQWLKEIPSHWEEKRAKYIYEKQNRIPEESDDVITCFRDGEVTLRKNRRTTGFTESLKEIGYQGIKEGDLVIHQMDAFAGATGVSDSNGKGTPVYSVCTPIDNKSLTKYHALVIRLMGLNGFIQSLYRGIRERSSDFRFDTFARQFLPLPPLDEQEKIVSYLEGKTSKIDAYVAEKEKEIQLLQELKQKTIADAVTKGLNPDVKMKDSGISWIGMMPEHWKLKIMKRVIKYHKAGAWGDEPNRYNYNLTCLRIADFDYNKLKFQHKQDYTIRSYKETELTDRILRKGDVLIEKSGGGEKSPVGRVVLYDLDIPNCMYANFMEKLVVIDIIESKFFTYLMNVAYTKRIIWKYVKFTTGIQNINIPSLLSNEKVILPPPDEQSAIVAYIDEKCQKIDTLVSELQAEIDNMKEYKQRLIADCVTGHVNVQNIKI